MVRGQGSKELFLAVLRETVLLYRTWAPCMQCQHSSLLSYLISPIIVPYFFIYLKFKFFQVLDSDIKKAALKEFLKNIERRSVRGETALSSGKTEGIDIGYSPMDSEACFRVPSPHNLPASLKKENN